MTNLNETGITQRRVFLEPIDINRIAKLCGSNNENIKQLAKNLNVAINHRGHVFQISGQVQQAAQAERIILNLYNELPVKEHLSAEDLQLSLQSSHTEPTSDPEYSLVTPQQTIVPKSPNQKQLIAELQQNDVQFVIGPAGTGKTFLAVAYAVHILKQQQVERICLMRPAVEAGENLGFLPGTLIEKINPYLQPLYDALYSTLGVESTNTMIRNNLIDINALAYMRGRTLNNCVAILDEGQNASQVQLKMFLTRLGHNSTAIITGDLTQIDLPKRASSGLTHAIEILENIHKIGVSRLTTRDVMRNPIVAKIITAYDKTPY